MLTEKNKVEKSLLNLEFNWTSFLCYMTNNYDIKEKITSFNLIYRSTCSDTRLQSNEG